MDNGGHELLFDQGYDVRSPGGTMPLYYASIQITAVADQAGQAAEALEGRIRSLRDEGRIHMAGRFEKDGGFLVVFEAKDLLDARSTMESLPLVKDGLAAWNYRRIDLME